MTTPRTTLRKLMIVPFFGDEVPWMKHWLRNTERMQSLGYDFLLDTDEADFQARVSERLGIVCPRMHNNGNSWDFRPALGVLYADEIDGFDWYGHCDFDVVFGRVERWITDEFLAPLDVFGCHDDYMSGPFSLYRNTPAVRELFFESPVWRERLEHDGGIGWLETDYTAVVDRAHAEGRIVRRYEKFQTASQDDFSGCVLHEDGRLTENGVERMLLHFRRPRDENGQKIYPLRCVRP